MRDDKKGLPDKGDAANAFLANVLGDSATSQDAGTLDVEQLIEEAATAPTHSEKAAKLDELVETAISGGFTPNEDAVISLLDHSITYDEDEPTADRDFFNTAYRLATLQDGLDGPPRSPDLAEKFYDLLCERHTDYDDKTIVPILDAALGGNTALTGALPDAMTFQLGAIIEERLEAPPTEYDQEPGKLGLLQKRIQATATVGAARPSKEKKPNGP